MVLNPLMMLKEEMEGEEEEGEQEDVQVEVVVEVVGEAEEGLLVTLKMWERTGMQK